MNKFSSILLLLLLAVLSVNAKVEDYPYVVTVNDMSEAHMDDSTFYQVAKSVVFPVNKWRINPESAFGKELTREIVPTMLLRGYKFAGVKMSGAASPEGPLGWNKTLSQYRVNSLKQYIAGLMSMPNCDDCITMNEAPEDYKYLVYLMKKAHDPDYRKVNYIVQTYDAKTDAGMTAIKQALKKEQKGQLWKRVFKKYFADIRSARVVLYFTPVDKSLGKFDYSQRVDSSVLSTNCSVKIPDSMAEVPVGVQHVATVKVKEPRREVLSIKTNLLFDAMYMPFGYNRYCPIPNVAIEYYPLHGHFTYGVSYDNPWWQDYDGHKYFQIRNYQVETRYYFRSGDISKNPPGKGAAFRGFYVQAYANGGLYGIMFTAKKGWVGEGIGAGIGLGYVMPLTHDGHWRLEAGIQAGYFGTKYDKFQYECPVDPTEHDNLYYYKWTLDASLFKKRQYRFNWMGPTRVGITLTYDLLYRPVHRKRGLSFKKWETTK